MAQRLLHHDYALCYTAIVPVIREIGRKHGYAIAVHGSMATDLDLIACPWTEDASDPDDLIEDICEYAGAALMPCEVKADKNNPFLKPHGRLAYSLWQEPRHRCDIGGPYFDISVMPRLAPAASQ